MGPCEESLGLVGKEFDRIISKQPTESSDSKELVEHLWNVHGYIITYFRYGDAKAALLILFNSSLLGVLYAQDIHRVVLDAAFCVSAQRPLAEWYHWPQILSPAAFALLTSGIVCAFLAVIPRLSVKKKKDFIYWDSIALHDDEKEHWELLKKARRDLPRRVANHLYTIAEIAKNKFLTLRWAMCLSFVGMIAAGAAILIQWIPI